VGSQWQVAAYAKHCAILAPSVEAKLYGVKTGMSVRDALLLSDSSSSAKPIHPSIARFMQTDRGVVKRLTPITSSQIHRRIRISHMGTPAVAREIKSRIKSEIGDYLRVSIGVSTNQILAKLASGLHKPDGFDVIDCANYLEIYQTIKLQDFCGINVRNEARLHRVGIFTPTQFYQADIQTLKQAFQSVLGRYWYTRLRGYEVDDVEFSRRSYGQSYVLPRPMSYEEWRPILVKLIAKAARRLREGGAYATGIGLALNFTDHTSWHTTHQGSNAIFDDASLLASALGLYEQNAPKQKVKKVAVTCFGLTYDSGQLSCLVDNVKQKSLVTSLDALNDKWGEYSVTYGSMMGSRGHVKDAIAFGK
jgi:DNA polymerase-4